MKKQYIIAAAILQLLIVGFAAPVLGESAVILLTSSEYPPYHGEYISSEGAVTEIIREAYGRVGYLVKIEFYPWMRAITMAKNGLADGSFTTWHTEERTNSFYYSAPIIANAVGFYKSKHMAFSFKSYADLKPYRIGIVFGYENPAGFNDKKLRKQVSYSDYENMLKLVRKKIDLALTDRILGRYLLEMEFPYGAKEFEFVEPPLEKKNLHLII